jgi:hypothetical protein
MAAMTARRVQAVKPRKPVATRVHLEDRGQDFLEWDLDADGLVIDARPFQAEIWRGVQVLNHRALRIGGALALRLVDGSERMLDYRAAGVMRMPRPEQGRAVR